MKKYALLILIMFFVGCKPNHNPYDNMDYRKGTEGIVLRFADDSPPSKIYDGSEVNLLLEVFNRGANDIEENEAIVYLSGFDPEAMSFEGSSQGKTFAKAVTATKGKNPYMPEGGYNLLEFKGQGKVHVPYGDSYSPTIMATSCYVYQTIATPTVCVISSPEDIIKQDICKPTPIDLDSQGGPVAVTRVEEEVLQQELNFIITVKNVGNGKVLNPETESMNNCPFQLTHEDLDIVNIDLEMSGAGEVSCNPEDKKIRLVNGKGVIFCRIPIELETSFTTPLVITLDYGYSTSITRQITIARPPGSTYEGQNQK